MSKITKWMEEQSAREDTFIQSVVSEVCKSPVKSTLIFAAATAVTVGVILGHKEIVNDIPNQLAANDTESEDPFVTKSPLTAYDVFCVDDNGTTRVFAAGEEIQVYAAVHSSASNLCSVAFSESFVDAITGEIHVHDATLVSMEEALHAQGQRLAAFQPG